MADWQAIRQEYEQGASLRQLATKHSVSKSTIERHAKMGQWDSQAGQRDNNPTPKKEDIERETIQSAFLDSFKKTANISDSCEAAGIDRSTFYDWLEKYESFSLLYNQAKEIANDAIRAEIRRRAVEGYTEQVVIGGKVQTVRKYSDTLLIFLAKSRMTEFREKQQLEVTTNPDVSGAKEVLLARLARLEGNE